MTETIGERLRRLRTERGLSQRELSSPGVSYAYISRIEAGARRPSVKALRMLARKLGVSAEFLETGSELGAGEARELRLADAELRLRLDGDSDEAAATLRAILDDSITAGDALAATRARIALGLAAHAAGRPDEAIVLLEQAIDSELVSPTTRPDAWASLGHAYAITGRTGRSVTLLEEALERVTTEAPTDTAGQVRFASYLSQALTDGGQFERAQSVLEDALGRTDGDEDPYTRVRIYWGLGRLAMNESKPLSALGFFRRAVALLEATEDTLHLARAYLSCGWVMIEGGQAKEAGAQLERAERLLAGQAENVDRVMLCAYGARRALLLGRPEDALKLAREALELAGDTLPEDRGQAMLTLAEALAALGDAAAEEAYRKAAEHIEAAGPPRFRADAYRGWARLLRAQGRESEALDLLERATEPVTSR